MRGGDTTHTAATLKYAVCSHDMCCVCVLCSPSSHLTTIPARTEPEVFWCAANCDVESMPRACARELLWVHRAHTATCAHFISDVVLCAGSLMWFECCFFLLSRVRFVTRICESNTLTIASHSMQGAST